MECLDISIIYILFTYHIWNHKGLLRVKDDIKNMPITKAQTGYVWAHWTLTFLKTPVCFIKHQEERSRLGERPCWGQVQVQRPSLFSSMCALISIFSQFFEQISKSCCFYCPKMMFLWRKTKLMWATIEFITFFCGCCVHLFWIQWDPPIRDRKLTKMVKDLRPWTNI